MWKNAAGLALIFIILFLLQILVCNQIMLFHVATPILFIYIIIRPAFGINMNLLYTVAFFSGLAVDIFSDTPGMNALAATIMSALRKPVLLAYIQRDDNIRKLVPSISSLGLWGYSKYMFTVVLIYCLLIFGIEYFSADYICDILIMSVSSAFLSFIILLGVDSLVSRG